MHKLQHFFKTLFLFFNKVFEADCRLFTHGNRFSAYKQQVNNKTAEISSGIHCPHNAVIKPKQQNKEYITKNKKSKKNTAALVENERPKKRIKS